MELMLGRLRTALAALTDRTYHYFAAPNSTPPYIVWAEDGDNDLEADNAHVEHIFAGTVDLYTNIEDDPLMESIPEALAGLPAAYYLNSVQYEEATGLIHYEWTWEYGENSV